MRRRPQNLLTGFGTSGPVQHRADDPDETEGRCLYRALADALARSQAEMAKRKVKLRKRYSARDYPL